MRFAPHPTCVPNLCLLVPQLHLSFHSTFSRAAGCRPALLYQVYSIAIEAGATTLNVPDTVGYTTPKEFLGLMHHLRRTVRCGMMAWVRVQRTSFRRLGPGPHTDASRAVLDWSDLEFSAAHRAVTRAFFSQFLLDGCLEKAFCGTDMVEAATLDVSSTPQRARIIAAHATTIPP